jgi:hypothetical protein
MTQIYDGEKATNGARTESRLSTTTPSHSVILADSDAAMLEAASKRQEPRHPPGLSVAPKRDPQRVLNR